MKIWALILIVAFVLPVHNAEAKKAPKRKIVAITFTETDLNTKREPASVDEQKEVDALTRHNERLAENNNWTPEL